MRQFTIFILCLFSSMNIFGYDKTESLLVNGDFSKGLDGWETVVSSTPQYSRIWIENGECHFSVGTSSSSFYYNCQIYQILKLQAGEYRCSFKFTGSGSKVFYILASEDDSFDTSWDTTDEILLREVKNNNEEFNPEYLYTLNKESYVMFRFSVNASYGNAVISDCKITRESIFLELEASSCERVYGDANPAFEVVYTGIVPGDESLIATNILPNFECAANELSNVGEYPINLACTGSVSGYEIQKYKVGTLKITPAPIIVSCNNIEREYGEINPVPTIEYTGFKNGENENVLSSRAIYNIYATAESNVGTYPVKLSGAYSTNYNFEYIDASMIISKAPLIGSICDSQKIYGDTNPSFQISYEGLKNNEITPSWIKHPTFITDADKHSSIGEYSVSAIEFEAVNYNIERIDNGLLSITPRDITLQALNINRLYYDENPSLDYMVTGFVNGDNEDDFLTKPLLSTTATKNSDVGNYDIVISNAKLKNYQIHFVNGTLTVNKRPLTIMADNKTRMYLSENPQLTYSIIGFVNNETDAVLLRKPNLRTNATTESDCGEYVIYVSDADAINYNCNYLNGVMGITKIDQQISWNQTFENILVGDQIELFATTDSGLEIDYIISGNVSEYKIGDRTFIDCLAEGPVILRATQDGNNNYNAAVRVVKSFNVSSQSSVNYVTSDNELFPFYIQDGYLKHNNSETTILIEVFNIKGEIVYTGLIRDIYLGNGLFLIKAGHHIYKIFVK